MTSQKDASPAEASVAIGTKRKRVSDPKFYSVRVGHRPGIYYSWSDCLAQVKGFKGAMFKSFHSLTDAERFLKGDNQFNGESSSNPSKFYAVRIGRVPGIYSNWASAQAQITGWTKPKYKCFSTRTEAERFLRDGGPQMTEESDAPETSYENSINGGLGDAGEVASKKAKRATAATNGADKNAKMAVQEYDPDAYEAGEGPLPPGAEDGFDPNIILDPASGRVVYKTALQKQATKLQANGQTRDSVLRIYTDGSSLKNGQVGAIAGVGVYFGPSDPRNISEALTGTRQTNQRAELTAIARAIDSAPKHIDVQIITDSKYAISCVTDWFKNWRKNGWKTSAGKVVENRDLVENIIGKIEERNALQAQTKFEWVKGHNSSAGNVEADKLAVNGARKAAELSLL